MYRYEKQKVDWRTPIIVWNEFLQKKTGNNREAILDKKKRKTDETFPELNKHMSAKIESVHWIPAR